MSLSILRKSLLTIYKNFFCPHLDYAYTEYIIHEKPSNVIFELKLERAQYNACSAITGTIQGTDKDSIYAELGLDHSRLEDGIENYLFFYKIMHDLSPAYLTTYTNFASDRSHHIRPSIEEHLKKTVFRTKIFQSRFFSCASEYGMILIFICKILIHVRKLKVKYRHLFRLVFSRFFDGRGNLTTLHFLLRQQ